MNKANILITGGNGFLGQHLVSYLLKKGSNRIVVFDRLRPEQGADKRVSYVRGDICVMAEVQKAFKTFGPFETVYHLASAMPDKAFTDEYTWRVSVDGTANVARAAAEHKAKSLVFTSSNVTYGIPVSLPVMEETPLKPIEVYGRSKVRAEEELAKFKGRMNIQMFRCPVITGEGRLGLQAILFEFISENRAVYVVGDGSNIYQFVDADDVCQALELASRAKGFDAYTIGADGVMPLRALYANVIRYAHSRSHIVTLPKAPALFTLSVLDKLGISPLGPYQYSMIGLSMYADTTKIKKKLGWKPKKTIADSFLENYRWYVAHKGGFAVVGNGSTSSNRSVPKMKIFKLLKYLS